MRLFTSEINAERFVTVVLSEGYPNFGSLRKLALVLSSVLELGETQKAEMSAAIFNQYCIDPLRSQSLTPNEIRFINEVVNFICGDTSAPMWIGCNVNTGVSMAVQVARSFKYDTASRYYH